MILTDLLPLKIDSKNRNLEGQILTWEIGFQDNPMQGAQPEQVFSVSFVSTEILSRVQCCQIKRISVQSQHRAQNQVLFWVFPMQSFLHAYEKRCLKRHKINFNKDDSWKGESHNSISIMISIRLSSPASTIFTPSSISSPSSPPSPSPHTVMTL